jgi:hypothetical protein
MRKLTVFALVALTLATFAGGQALAGGGPSINVTVTGFNCSIDCESQDVASIRGTLACSPNGAAYFFRVNLRQQKITRAVGRASGTCTGSLQPWTTNRVDNPKALNCDFPIVAQGQGTVGGEKFKIPQQTLQCPGN